MTFLADSHTHFFSRCLFETLGASSPLSGSVEERIERITRHLGVALPSADPEEHLARWLDELERHGVSHAVSFASVSEENEVLAELAYRARGRLSFFAYVDPRRSEAVSELARLLAQGSVRGALFFPSLHRYSLDGEEAARAFAVLAESGAPALVHCGLLRIPLRERFGLPRQIDLECSNPLRLTGMADRFPSLPFVIPHFGSGFLRETLLLGAQCANVYVDTSSSNTWMHTQPARLTLADVFERALKVFGPERILFGTDSSTFPRGWRREILLIQREALGACGVREEDRARILGLNLAQLLRLSA
jgi:predicted TIM-barrel fold metal-dependent hydrolase